MAAKKAKLHDQFLIDSKELPDSSKIFQGVAIFVNGYSGNDKAFYINTRNFPESYQ